MEHIMKRLSRNMKSFEIAENACTIAFGEFVLDPANGLLWRGRERIALPPKPFGVLCYLVERAGKLVTKDEIFDAIWPNLHVTESSLTVSVCALRLTLRDDSKLPRYLETVTRRGYRFIAPIDVQLDDAPVFPMLAHQSLRSKPISYCVQPRRYRL
jgi:DNA-binding winged helix-turn-helix (wHTH) protein